MCVSFALHLFNLMNSKTSKSSLYHAHRTKMENNKVLIDSLADTLRPRDRDERISVEVYICANALILGYQMFLVRRTI